MKIEMQGDNILLKLKLKETKSTYVTGNEEKTEKSLYEVICTSTPFTNEGDTVIVGEYIGDKVEIEGIEYKIVKESQILAIIKKQENEI